MKKKTITCDFETEISRTGTHAKKYTARKRLFGTSEIEPLWLADMDLQAPAFLLEQIRARLEHPILGYTEAYDEVFEAIGWWMEKEHGASVERAWILLSPSVVSSLAEAVQFLTEPSESVALLSPVYGPFFSCATLNGRQVADCPLHVENDRFEIDFELLSANLARSEVKLLLLCNPHNPGGRVWRQEELAAIANLCAEHGTVLFSDEIHSDIVYPPGRHISMLNIEAAKENLIMAHSIGKTFNTSGLKSAFVVIPNERLRKRFTAVLAANHSEGINLLGKVALETVFSAEGAAYKRQLVTFLRENTLKAAQRLSDIRGVRVMIPEATFLVWCDFRSLGRWQEVSRRLINHAQVALSGGTFFGPAGKGWFRINCALPRLRLLYAVDRIVEAFTD